MVICPIARAVHCTGCIFFKFCPAKSILGDYRKDGDDSAETDADKKKKKKERAEESSADSPSQSNSD